ncbi:hypothetical protein ACVWWG_008459 [Bradyrhizobium sp. LB7.2]
MPNDRTSEEKSNDEKLGCLAGCLGCSPFERTACLGANLQDLLRAAGRVYEELCRTGMQDRVSDVSQVLQEVKETGPRSSTATCLIAALAAGIGGLVTLDAGFVAADALIPTLTAAAQPAEHNAPLELEAKILLGDVRGRIDHLAVDLKRQRLFVAELGNDSVGVVDMAAHSLLRTVTGLNEPQGVGYEPTTDTLYVANARDGSVRLFEANEYKATGRIELGSDADNIRIDAAAKRVVVGYGDGGLAILDPSTRAKVRSAPLKAHPGKLPA